ncbi:MAG: hypothetical protein HQ547_04675 [Candidatus Omnitrophica bacterium]|nr:hypothetical protein [Candidatus Omnitrophota bacterium]
MKEKKINSTQYTIQIIEHIEAELSKLKETLKEAASSPKKDKKEYRSVREYEFCGMWKNRKDIEGLSTTELLSKIRREQWGIV